MVTIPRAEIQAIAERHRHDYGLAHDPRAEWVRAEAEDLRTGRHRVSELDHPGQLADDLDALADRYEREATQ